MTQVTLFRGDKHDVVPSSAVEVADFPAWLCELCEQAPGHAKGERGFVCFVRMRGGTDLTIAELNLQRAKESKPPLSQETENRIRMRGYRNYAHVAEVTAIGIDYDEFPELPPDWRPELWPCDVYAHSTHSYHPESAPGKWRVVLPLDPPLPIEREQALRRVLQSMLPAGCIVRAPHQPAYLPTCPEGMTPQVVHVRQTEVPAALDWRKLVDLDTPLTVHATGDAAGTLLGAEFNKRDLVMRDLGAKLDVVCPWAAEHQSGGDLGFLYYTDDGLGKFGCAHSSCTSARRGSVDVFELWELAGPENALVSLPEASAPPSKKKTSFPLMTAEDMSAAETELPWVVRDLISVGEPTLIVGGAGSGKTSAAVDLALSVATGRPVWGRFEVARPGPVVHIDYEQGKTLRRTYRAFAAGRGVDAAELVRSGALRIATLPREQLLDPNVTDAHLQKVGIELVELCTGASLAIVNSLTAGTNKVSENDAKIAAVFNLLSRVTERTGCAFVVLHHSGRSDRKGARGSSAIDGAVQTIFEITSKRKQTFTVWEHTKDRPAGGDTAKFRLHWAHEGAVQTLRHEEIVEVEAGPEGETIEQRTEKAILFVMANCGLSGKDRILERVRGKKTSKRLVWEDMLVRGVIEHLGTRYMVAAGTLAPSKQPEGVREDED